MGRYSRGETTSDDHVYSKVKGIVLLMKSIKEHQRHGLLSPIENPYVINEFGYVSQESAGFYEKFMSKYCNVEPEGYYLGPPSSKEMKELKEKKKPSKTKTPGIRKKVKSKALISDDDDDDDDDESVGQSRTGKSSEGDEKPKVPKIRILLPARTSENEARDAAASDGKPDSGKDDKNRIGVRGQTKSRRGANDMRDLAPQKRRYVPAPLNFEELLKLAEKKQHEPVLLPGSEYDSKRPMTKKEKAIYLQRMERIRKRKEEKEMKKEKATSSVQGS